VVEHINIEFALVREPRVFLFDEPLSNLDAKLRVQVRAEIKRLHQRVRRTMIYVTHDQIEAMTLGDRIAVLRAGVLQQVADPFTLYEQPANAFVAGFIGSPPINFFAATLSAAGAPALEATGFSLTLSTGLGTRLSAYRGRPIQIGLRPEDLTAAAPGSDAGIPALVEVSEPLGNEVLVHWSTPVGTMVSRVPGQHAPGVGEEAKLQFAESKLRCFDPETERAIGTG